MFVPGIRGVTKTIYFPLIDAGTQDFLTGATDGGTDCDIIKDGGASSVCTNDFAEEGNGWYSLILTATEMEADQVLISIIDAAGAAFEDQGVLIDTIFGPALSAYGAVERYTVNDTDVTPTSTQFQADRGFGRAEEATNEHFKNRKIVFITGAAAGELANIDDYTQTNGRGDFTVPTMVTTVVNGDIFVIL